MWLKILFISVSSFLSLSPAPVFINESAAFTRCRSNYAVFSTNAYRTASSKYRADRTDDNGDGNIFLFVAIGETSANFVLRETPGTTSHTTSLTMVSLVCHTVNLTTERAGRRCTTVMVNGQTPLSGS